jgi:hypothetical protein
VAFDRRAIEEAWRGPGGLGSDMTLYYLTTFG